MSNGREDPGSKSADRSRLALNEGETYSGVWASFYALRCCPTPPQSLSYHWRYFLRYRPCRHFCSCRSCSCSCRSCLCSYRSCPCSYRSFSCRSSACCSLLQTQKVGQGLGLNASCLLRRRCGRDWLEQRRGREPGWPRHCLVRRRRSCQTRQW
jgi:hypothetical protein